MRPHQQAAYRTWGKPGNQLTGIELTCLDTAFQLEPVLPLFRSNTQTRNRNPSSGFILAPHIHCVPESGPFGLLPGTCCSCPATLPGSSQSPPIMQNTRCTPSSPTSPISACCAVIFLKHKFDLIISLLLYCLQDKDQNSQTRVQQQWPADHQRLSRAPGDGIYSPQGI